MALGQRSGRSHAPAVALGLALVMGMIAAGRAAASPAPGAGGGAWQLAPVLLYGKEVPDLQGKKVAETGRLYAIDAETFAVWACGDETPQVWVLLGVRAGRVETLAVEKSAEGRGAKGKSGVLAVRRQEPGMGSRLGVSVAAGQGVVYLQEKSFDPVPTGGTDPIQIWDGRGLRRLLGPGDEIAFRGQTYRLTGATLGNVNASGTALIILKTSKGFGLALHDAKGLHPLVVEDQPVPGRPDAHLTDSAMSCRGLNVEEAVLADDGAVVLTAYLDDQRGTRKGIYAVTESGVRELVAAGDPCPDEADAKVKSCIFQVIEARSVSQLVALFSCGTPRARVWDGTSWTAVASGDLTVNQAAMLAPGSPWVFWKGTSEREQRKGGEKVKFYAEGWGLFDGARSRDVRTKGNNPTGFETVAGGAGWEGIILQYGWGVQLFDDKFLDAHAPEKGLQPVPGIKTAQGPLVLASDVLAWTGETSALVVVRPWSEGAERTAAGIYLMTSAPPAP